MVTFDSERFRKRIADAVGDGAEQLALMARDEAPDPSGESRSGGQSLFGFGYGGSQSSSSGDGATEPDRVDPPDDLDEFWHVYKTFSLVREPVRKFSSEVVEPGYRVHAGHDELEADLMAWASNCAIRAGEMGQDLTGLLSDIVIQRRVRGTALMEKSGSKANPDVLAGLVLHDPSTFKTYTRPGQNILLLPDDPPGKKGMRTSSGDTAAYVQYDDSLGYGDADSIPFSQEELVKFAYDADVNELWGESLFASIHDRIKSLRKKLQDSDAAIEMKGHPHHIYELPWGREQAQEYKAKHEAGEFSTGQKDFVPEGVEVTVVHGETADIEFAVRVDLESIFAALPVPKYQIAFESDINQHVVEVQEAAYAQLVDDERRYLENKFTPIFEEKAEELAQRADTPYELDDIDEVSFTISQPPDANPLNRQEFDAEAFATMLNAWSNAGIPLSKELVAWFMNVDISEVEEMLRAEAVANAIAETEFDGEDEPDVDDLGLDNAMNNAGGQVPAAITNLPNPNDNLNQALREAQRSDASNATATQESDD